MTIAEIASRAGVSKAAVSRYLNNGYVSSEKREAIRRVIEETGYVPSQQAQTLRTGKSRMVGVIVPRIDSESISRVVAGISRVLEEHDYHLLLANTDNNIHKELEYLEVFRSGNVDGVILVATILSGAHRQALAALESPVVLVGQRMEGMTCVFHDDRGAAAAVTGLLLGGGRRRIGYIGVTPRDKAAGAARRAGWQDAVRAAGLEPDPAWMEQSDSLDRRRLCSRRAAARAGARSRGHLLCNRFHSDRRKKAPRGGRPPHPAGDCAGRHRPLAAERTCASPHCDRALLLSDKRRGSRARPARNARAGDRPQKTAHARL